jgi:hypothetical protein
MTKLKFDVIKETNEICRTHFFSQRVTKVEDCQSSFSLKIVIYEAFTSV